MRTEETQIRGAVPHQIPILRDLRRLNAELGGEAEPEVFTSQLERHHVLVGQLTAKGRVVRIMASERFPSMPPLVLTEDAEGNAVQHQISWRLDAAPEDRLSLALGDWPRPLAAAPAAKNARQEVLRRAPFFRFRTLRRLI